MVNIHATRKLLNTSRIEAPLYISQPDEGQLLHSWYCSLLSTGFQGKMLVMYVHEPSLLTVVCRGKTIKSTWLEFKLRLPEVLKKVDLNSRSIKFESSLVNDYVVSKTNSRSMLAYMNGMAYQLEFMCSKFDRYDEIELGLLEDQMMTWLYQDPNKKSAFTTPLAYWKEQITRL